MANLLTELRNHLVSAGVVRNPLVAGAQPPMWLEPKLGTPAPAEKPPRGDDTQIGPTAVVGALLTGGIPAAPYMSFARKPIVDLRLRTTTALIAEQLELAITAAIADRRDFMLGAMYCIECEQWRALQRLGSGPQGFEYVTAYVFELLRT
jgi:hypothetical protein